MALTHDDMVKLVNNPGRGVSTIINELETAWFDKRVQINSKSHPFVFASDVIIGSSYGVLNRVLDGISRNFAVHSRNVSEISPHMADDEKVGMFGTPSTMTLEFAIEEETLLEIAKEVTVQMGKSTFTYQMILIPKDTEITFNGYTFCVENGIEIRWSDKTGYQVVYDETTNNPFNPIANNLLTKERRPGRDKWYLIVAVPVRQLACKAIENVTSNKASGCRDTVEYQDNLYAIRAFLTQDGVRREIKVSYDQDVFAPLQPTLAINLKSANTFDYEIPDVYIENETGIGTLSIYVWTTKGALEKDFQDIDLSTVEKNYQDYRYGAGTLNEFSAALKSVGGTVWKAATVTTGGSAALPFETIKRTFILGRRQRVLPITENNLAGTVEERDYNSVKTIDYMTGRSYAVTKELPVQDNKKFYAPMSTFVGSYRASVVDLIRSGVVLDNGDRVTIPHNVLFDITEPTTELVTAYTKNQYLGLAKEDLVDLVQNKTLVYTPFYYVLDITNTQVTLRTYHLDQPEVNYQTFIQENTALGLEVGVGAISVEHEEDGYLITVTTTSGQSYKELASDTLGIQLSFEAVDTNSLASVAGTLYGETADGERIFQFKLASRFDVDVNHVLYFTNFNQFGERQPQTGIDLKQNVKLIFTFKGDKEFTQSPIDAKIDDTIFADDMVGIIETDYNITFGKYMGNLYSRIRPLVGEAQYQRYPSDVPATYKETKYKRDDKGQLVWVNGKMVVEHTAGEVMKNSSGDTILAYRAGDVILDEHGDPIELLPRDRQYHWDFIGFDATYFFSLDDYDHQFAQDTKDFFVNNIDKDMNYFTSMAVNQTTLVFQPRNKLGYQKVVINSNAQTLLKQDLSFVVTFYLSQSGYKNQNLKETLQTAAPRIINSWLYDETSVANSDLTAMLKDIAKVDVKAVKIDAHSGNTIIDIISNADSLSGFSVRKLLRLSGDGLLSVQEDIDVTFLPHDVKMVDMIG